MLTEISTIKVCLWVFWALVGQSQNPETRSFRPVGGSYTGVMENLDSIGTLAYALSESLVTVIILG